MNHLVSTLPRRDVAVLSWGSPWPPRGGATLRTYGILTELAKRYNVTLVVLGSRPLEVEQTKNLASMTKEIVQVAMGTGAGAALAVVRRMITGGVPYHCALVKEAFERDRKAHRLIESFPGPVYANFGHWGTLLDSCDARWILDQQNADIQFWQAYASYAGGFRKLAALINGRLAARHFPQVYRRIGCVVAVCEEDARLTRQVAPDTVVHVVENGVDCSYMTPRRRVAGRLPRLLFTGTSVPRNVAALRWFVRRVWPRVSRVVPDAEFIVAGAFDLRAQTEFAGVVGMSFTGRVDDIRPYFDDAAVYVAPFHESHGSKLKIAEALSMGLPIVSTEAGARGFGVNAGEHLLIARDAGQFAEECVRMLQDREEAEEMGNRARTYAIAHLDWGVLGERLTSIVESVYDGL